MQQNSKLEMILQLFSLQEKDEIGRGVESIVYRLDDTRVLKIYNSLSSLEKQKVLKTFYENIIADSVSFEFPQIYEIREIDGFLITIEKQIKGISLSQTSHEIVLEKQDILIDRYIEALLHVQQIKFKTPIGRYKIFDDYGISDVSKGDWNAFLLSYIQMKKNEVETYLQKDVLNFSFKSSLLENALCKPYTGIYALIHGDYFAGNILVDNQYMIKGIIDFGIMTMIGDPLFDLATGCEFFDMYNDLHKDLSTKTRERMIARVGENLRPKIYLYILIYSIVAANMLSSTCSDGHYRWCISNLNKEEYWKFL